MITQREVRVKQAPAFDNIRASCYHSIAIAKGARWSRVVVSHARKVRTPQSTVLGNTQAG